MSIQTDIYAIGLILLVCLSGKHPFEDSDSIENLKKRAEGKFDDIVKTGDFCRCFWKTGAVINYFSRIIKGFVIHT